MNTQDSTANETTNGGKSLKNFTGDSVNGTDIMGGGKGTITLPTADDGTTGMDNPEFVPLEDGNVTYNDDGSIQVVNDGTIKVG